MVKLNHNGAVSGLGASLILSLILLFTAIGFAAWAFISRQDYKTNVDTKISAAVEEAKADTSAKKEAEFAEASKKPFKIYRGPEVYGSVVTEYPKTWSGYVEDNGTGIAVVNGYFAPGVVPSIHDRNSVFALRFQLLNQTYSQVLQGFAGQQQAGKLSVKAYALPKLPNIVGVQLTGQLSDQRNVTMVVLPFRAQTLQIWTEGNEYLSDFNNNILPNFSFAP